MTVRRPARHRCRSASAWACALLVALATAPARAEDAPVRSSPAPAPAASSAARAKPPPPAAVQSLDDLRDRLSQRIGSTRAVDPKNVVVMQVGKPAANDLQVSALDAPAAAARSPATAARSPAARLAKPAARAAQAAAGGPPGKAADWHYDGEQGPQAWGTMKADFATCATGQRQSPIDIRDGIAVELEPVRFDYRASPFSVIDTGHTVQVDLPPGNAIEVLGRRYELLQFHFHRPSEERIGGRRFDMVAHLVHKDAEGRLAVVAILLESGSVQPVVQQVWNNLPLEKGEAQPARATLDPNALLPQDRRYYTYMGSLTTPPCSEGVLWMVMQQPVPIAPEQIGIFARLYPMNARPVQATAGRLIKQSN